MKTASPVDAARIELLLSDLRLPAIKLMWAGPIWCCKPFIILDPVSYGRSSPCPVRVQA
jgi:hypothetical protein